MYICSSCQGNRYHIYMRGHMHTSYPSGCQDHTCILKNNTHKFIITRWGYRSENILSLKYLWFADVPIFKSQSFTSYYEGEIDLEIRPDFYLSSFCHYLELPKTKDRLVSANLPPSATLDYPLFQARLEKYLFTCTVPVPMSIKSLTLSVWPTNWVWNTFCPSL